MAASNDLGTWAPLSPEEIGTIFRSYPGRWCIAGGWALDLFAEPRSRPHDDIDIVILRNDLPRIHEALPDWDLHAAHGILTPWPAGTSLPVGAHDIWCKQRDGQRTGQRGQVERPWKFQLMVIDTEGEDWLFRRDHRIRGPLATMTVERAGLPVLAPEIQLLYKSKLLDRPKNAHDFTASAPLLSPAQRDWLTRALVLLYSDHPWLDALRHLST